MQIAYTFLSTHFTYRFLDYINKQQATLLFVSLKDRLSRGSMCLTTSKRIWAEGLLQKIMSIKEGSNIVNIESKWMPAQNIIGWISKYTNVSKKEALYLLL